MRYIFLLVLLLLPVNSYCFGFGSYMGKAVSGSTPAPTYLFSWDAETTTADIYGGGTLVGVAVPGAELSTDQAVSPTHSVKSDLQNEYYTFTDSGVVNPHKGKITFWLYGNNTDTGQITVFAALSDGTENMSILVIAADALLVYTNFTVGAMYATSDTGSLNSAQWNKCVFQWDDTSGSTVWSWVINDIAAGDGTDIDTWDVGSSVTGLRVGQITAELPVVPSYIDDVLVEQ